MNDWPQKQYPQQDWHRMERERQWEMEMMRRQQMIETEQQQMTEDERLRFFGGVQSDEQSLLTPMLQVVQYLFDGYTDYEDP
jgi:hypothetical protein